MHPNTPNNPINPAGDNLVPGTLFDGTYRVMGPLGEGGMASVYLVRHEAMDKVMALKVLRDAGTDQVLLTRFQNEARTIARLQHPNIVQVYNFGVEGNRLPYLVMEVVEGQSLDRLLKTDGPLSPSRALDIVAQVADALALAHSKGVIHRDLKPANLMLPDAPRGSADQIKILDFGIAKDEKQALTAQGQVFGSPFYMSPEQFVGQPVTPKSDIYSLGVTLYQLLTGTLPYAGRTFAETAQKHMHDPVPSFADFDLGLDAAAVEALDELLEGMMTKDAQFRYGSMSELLTEIKSVRRMVQGQAVRNPDDRDRLFLDQGENGGDVDEAGWDSQAVSMAGESRGFWQRRSAAIVVGAALVAISIGVIATIGLSATHKKAEAPKPSKLSDTEIGARELALGMKPPPDTTDGEFKFKKVDGKISSISIRDFLQKRPSLGSGKIEWTALAPGAVFWSDPKNVARFTPDIYIQSFDMGNIMTELMDRPELLGPVMRNTMDFVKKRKDIDSFYFYFSDLMPRTLVADVMAQKPYRHVMFNQLDDIYCHNLATDKRIDWSRLQAVFVNSGKSLRGLFDALPKAPKLRAVHLQDVPVKVGDLQALTHLPKLDYLELIDCKMQDIKDLRPATVTPPRHKVQVVQLRIYEELIDAKIISNLQRFVDAEWVMLFHQQLKGGAVYSVNEDLEQSLTDSYRLSPELLAAVGAYPGLKALNLRDYDIHNDDLPALFALKNHPALIFSDSIVDVALLARLARQHPGTGVQIDQGSRKRLETTHGRDYLRKMGITKLPPNMTIL